MHTKEKTKDESTAKYKSRKSNRDDISLRKRVEYIKDLYKKEVWKDSLPETVKGLDLAFRKIPRYENNILAFVYMFASLLVLVLGLRGMGSSMPEIFNFLKDSSGKLSSYIILGALVIESIMILLLAYTTYHKVEDFNGLFKEYWRDVKDIDTKEQEEEFLNSLSPCDIESEPSHRKTKSNLDDLEKQIKEDVEKILSIKKTLNEFAEKLRQS